MVLVTLEWCDGLRSAERIAKLETAEQMEFLASAVRPQSANGFGR